ncbi:hypothetical protein T484DRAFT_1878732, partial [Baffinella frigidus]
RLAESAARSALERPRDRSRGRRSQLSEVTALSCSAVARIPTRGPPRSPFPA